MRLKENFRGPAPDDHRSRNFIFLLKVLNVVLDLHRQVVLGLALLDVSSGKLLHIILVECSLHRADLAEEFLHFGQMLRAQHGGILGGFIGGVRKNIPSAEHEILQFLDGNEILDHRRAGLGSLAQPDRAELSQRSHRMRFLAPDQVHTGHERGRHRSHPDGKNSQFSLWRSNSGKPTHS